MRTLLAVPLLLAACTGGDTFTSFDASDDDAATVDGSPLDPDATTPDAMPIDAAPIDAVSGTWGTPQSLALNTDESETMAKAAPSATELYFASPPNTGTVVLDLYYVTRTGPSFDWGGSRTGVGALNTTETETEPVVSADGLEMIFRRGATLYSSKRATTGSAWGAATTTGLSGSRPDLLADGLTLYYRDTSATCPVQTCRVKVTRSSPTAAWGDPVVESVSNTGEYQFVDFSGDGLRAMLSGPISTTVAPIAIASRATRTDAWGAPVVLSDLALYTGIRWAHWSWDETEMYLGFTTGGSDIYVSRFE
jgi:hypothetical protein